MTDRSLRWISIAVINQSTRILLQSKIIAGELLETAATKSLTLVVAAMEIRNRKRPKSTILRKCPTSLMDRAPTSPYPVAPSKYLGAS
jgi:hypothetical protein